MHQNSPDERSDAVLIVPMVKPEETTIMTDETPKTVTLNDLCRELKIDPRDARMVLRLASKKAKEFPNLTKDHVARQPWEWASGSKGLDEARKALTTAPST